MSLLARFFSAAPDIALGGAFLITWIRPYAFGDSMVKYAMVMMLLEFIVVHSAALMGFALWESELAQGRRVLSVLGLGAIYSVFLTAFGLALGEWWPIWAFWVLIANRLAGALLTASTGKVPKRMTNQWGLSVGLYILWILITSVLPIPALGITPEVAAGTGITGEGLWVQQPQRVVLAGAGYFLSQAWAELSGAADAS